jgi:hypothetical protein
MTREEMETFLSKAYYQDYRVNWSRLARLQGKKGDRTDQTGVEKLVLEINEMTHRIRSAAWLFLTRIVTPEQLHCFAKVGLSTDKVLAIWQSEQRQIRLKVLEQFETAALRQKSKQKCDYPSWMVFLSYQIKEEILRRLEGIFLSADFLNQYKRYRGLREYERLEPVILKCMAKVVAGVKAGFDDDHLAAQIISDTLANVWSTYLQPTSPDIEEDSIVNLLNRIAANCRKQAFTEKEQLQGLEKIFTAVDKEEIQDWICRRIVIADYRNPLAAEVVAGDLAGCFWKAIEDLSTSALGKSMTFKRIKTKLTEYWQDLDENTKILGQGMINALINRFTRSRFPKSLDTGTGEDEDDQWERLSPDSVDHFDPAQNRLDPEQNAVDQQGLTIAHSILLARLNELAQADTTLRMLCLLSRYFFDIRPLDLIAYYFRPLIWSGIDFDQHPQCLDRWQQEILGRPDPYRFFTQAYLLPKVFGYRHHQTLVPPDPPPFITDDLKEQLAGLERKPLPNLFDIDPEILNAFLPSAAEQDKHIINTLKQYRWAWIPWLTALGLNHDSARSAVLTGKECQGLTAPRIRHRIETESKNLQLMLRQKNKIVGKIWITTGKSTFRSVYRYLKQ